MTCTKPLHFKYKGQTIYHGDAVHCIIQDTIITDARISIDDYGGIYICQNKMDGNSTDDRLGYKYSWAIGSQNTVNFDGVGINVTAFKLLKTDPTYEVY